MDTVTTFLDEDHLRETLSEELNRLRDARSQAARLRIAGMAGEGRIREFATELRENSGGGRKSKRLIGDVQREVKKATSVHTQRFNQEQLVLWALRETLAALQSEKEPRAEPDSPALKSFAEGVRCRERAVEALAEVLQLSERLTGLSGDGKPGEAVQMLDSRAELLHRSISLLGDSEQYELEACRTGNRPSGIVIDAAPSDSEEPAAAPPDPVDALGVLETELGRIRASLLSEGAERDRRHAEKLDALREELDAARADLEKVREDSDALLEELETVTTARDELAERIEAAESSKEEFQKERDEAKAALDEALGEKDEALAQMESLIGRLRGSLNAE